MLWWAFSITIKIYLEYYENSFGEKNNETTLKIQYNHVYGVIKRDKCHFTVFSSILVIKFNWKNTLKSFKYAFSVYFQLNLKNV